MANKTLKRIWEGSNTYSFPDSNNNITNVKAETYEEATHKYMLFCNPNYKDYDWE